eukprot:2272002-Amphidinium_carterae.1
MGRPQRSRSPTGHNKLNPLNGKPFSERYKELLRVRQKLPCWASKDKAIQMVESSQTTLLIGETGSGKTTQVPQFLLSYAQTGIIAVTQPRRVAAMSVASRVAQELDVELGAEVGYLIRFEDVTSEATKLKYMTDGMLLRECMSDPLMRNYSLIVLDEAHERTLSTDILFGLLKEVLAKRPELRCLVMSATLESQKFQAYWSNAPLLQVPGRVFPVETFFSLHAQKDYVEAAVETCVQIHNYEGPGDILLFLTGEEEIEQAAFQIQDRCSDDTKVVVLPLYSSLPMHLQRRVFPPDKDGRRKVIVATNIAETSLTIDGVVYVVDPGLFKQNLYNPRTHSESLLVSAISRASAMQRAGRAGRTRPGKCFRLYTKESFEGDLPETNIPEMMRSNLCSVVLTLKKLGIEDIVHFDFMEPPTPESMMRALEMLRFLDAIDDESDLTDVGRTMSEFPVDPHLSRVVIAAAANGCCEEMLMVVAMLSVPPVFLRPRNAQKAADRAHQTFASGFGDHLSMLATFSQYVSSESKQDFCREYFVQERNMKQAESVRKQLRGISRSRGLITEEAIQAKSLTSSLRKSLIQGFFMQCAYIETGGKHYWTVREHQMCYIHPSSFLQHKPEWVLFHETVVTDRCYMRSASAITPEMLIEVCPQFYHPEQCKFDEAAKQLLQRALPRAQSQ